MIDDANPLEIASIGQSEADRAAVYKERARKLVVELCALMDESLRDGLLIRFQNIVINPYGKHEVVDLHIEKRF